MPQQVAVALKPVIAKIEFDYFVTAFAEPFDKWGTSRWREAYTMRLGTTNLPTASLWPTNT